MPQILQKNILGTGFDIGDIFAGVFGPRDCTLRIGGKGIGKLDHWCMALSQVAPDRVDHLWGVQRCQQSLEKNRARAIEKWISPSL